MRAIIAAEGGRTSDMNSGFAKAQELIILVKFD